MLSVPKGLICKFYQHWAISPDLHVQMPLDISNLDVPQTQHVKNGSHLLSLLPTFTLNACFAALDMHLDKWHCPSNQWKNLSFPRRFILPKSLCLINYQIHLLLASTTIFILYLVVNYLYPSSLKIYPSEHIFLEHKNQIPGLKFLKNSYPLLYYLNEVFSWYEPFPFCSSNAKFLMIPPQRTPFLFTSLHGMPSPIPSRYMAIHQLPAHDTFMNSSMKLRSLPYLFFDYTCKYKFIIVLTTLYYNYLSDIRGLELPLFFVPVSNTMSPHTKGIQYIFIKLMD